MTQEELRHYLGASPSVYVQVASPDDGSPEVAWGDTFFFVREVGGEPKKMPFATIVTKDYNGFDGYSRLDRGGLYRLNVEVGSQKFQELFGFSPKELPQHVASFDFEAMSQLFPHPTYGAYGWVSIVNPGEHVRGTVVELLDLSLSRAINRGAR